MVLYAPPVRHQYGESSGRPDVGSGLAEGLQPSPAAGSANAEPAVAGAPTAAAPLSTSGGGWIDEAGRREDSAAQHSFRRGRQPAVDPRPQLSELLSRNVASGQYATGRAIDPRYPDVSMPQACMPRIKHRTMTSPLALPLSKRQSERLKAAQVHAGQERDVNPDGVPETRLPWTLRPDADFKIVNHKAWSTGVVVPAMKQVCAGRVGVLVVALRELCREAGLPGRSLLHVACVARLLSLDRKRRKDQNTKILSLCRSKFVVPQLFLRLFAVGAYL